MKKFLVAASVIALMSIVSVNTVSAHGTNIQDLGGSYFVSESMTNPGTPYTGEYMTDSDMYQTNNININNLSFDNSSYSEYNESDLPDEEDIYAVCVITYENEVFCIAR